MSNLEIFVSIVGLLLGYFIVSKLLEKLSFSKTKNDTTEAENIKKVSGIRSPTSEELKNNNIPPSGYISNHWQGNHSLARSFWINNFALNLLLIATIFYWLNAGTPTEDPVFLARIVLALFVFHYVLLMPWQIVGLFRSANNYISNNGKSFWPRIVKLLIILNIFSTVIDISSELDFYKDKFHDSFFLTKDSNYEVTLFGDTIYLDGNFDYGISETVENLLSSNMNVNSIVLESPGGLLYEGSELSKLILVKSLDTYSYGQCSSACTIAFISGNKRYLSPNAKLGFHQYSYYRPSKMVNLDLFNSQSDDAIFFNRRGVNTEFTDNMFKAKSDDMWYPTIQELIKYGVIHGVVDP